MAAILELLLPGQAQERFMHQSRGVERLPRFLVRQPLSREPAQFVVDQRHEPRGRQRVATANLLKDLCDFIHGGEFTRNHGFGCTRIAESGIGP